MGTRKVRRKRLKKEELETEEVGASLKLVESNEEQEGIVDSLDDGFGDLHGGGHGEEEVWLISYADLMTLLVAFFALLLSFSKIDPNQFEKVKEEATKAFGGQYQVPYQDLADSMRNVLDKNGLTDKVFVEQNPDGIALSFKGNLLFDSGEVELKKQANDILDQVIPIVTTQAKGFGVVIEGHTDSVAIEEGLVKSNWELSGLRASAVARKFLASNFPSTKLRIEGYADTVPIVKTENLNLEQKRLAWAQNRRVVVRILKRF